MQLMLVLETKPNSCGQKKELTILKFVWIQVDWMRDREWRYQIEVIKESIQKMKYR